MSEIEVEIDHMNLVNVLMATLHKQLKAIPEDVLKDAYNLCEFGISAAPVYMAMGNTLDYMDTAEKKQQIIKHLIEIKKLLSEMEK